MLNDITASGACTNNVSAAVAGRVAAVAAPGTAVGSAFGTTAVADVADVADALAWDEAAAPVAVESATVVETAGAGGVGIRSGVTATTTPVNSKARTKRFSI